MLLFRLYGRADEGRGYTQVTTHLLLCILLLHKELNITDFSIESNLASPLEAKSRVLLTLTKRIQYPVELPPRLLLNILCITHELNLHCTLIKIH